MNGYWHGRDQLRIAELERQVARLKRELAELRAPLERMLQRDLDAQQLQVELMVAAAAHEADAQRGDSK